MTIKREVDGKMMEFELTNGEVWNAYDELEHKDDIALVKFYVEDGEVPDDKISAVAYRFRKLYNLYLDADADVRYECVCDAMKEVLGNDY